MPVAAVRYTGNQFGMAAFTEGLNDQLGVWATNNSGQYLAHGDVVVWDTRTALDTHETDVNVAFTLTRASQTIAVDSTTGFATTGSILVQATMVTGGPAVAVTAVYTGVDATDFTGATAYGPSITNGVADEAIIVVPPLALATTPVTTGQLAGMVAAPADAGRFVTLSGLAQEAWVAGVVSVTGDAGTATNGQAGGGGFAPPPGWAGYTGGAVPVVPPGAQCFICQQGVARVQVGANTVAARAILGTSTIPGAAIGSATLGNMLGIALEAQTAKDANNTIRAKICIG